MTVRLYISLVCSAFALLGATRPASSQTRIPPPPSEGASTPNRGISACQVGIYEYASYVAIRDRGLSETAVPVQALDGPEKAKTEAARRAVAHQIWMHPSWDAAEVKRRYMIKCRELEGAGGKPPSAVESLL